MESDHHDIPPLDVIGCVILIAVLIFLVVFGRSEAFASFKAAPQRLVQAAHQKNEPHKVHKLEQRAWIICFVFKSHCIEALNVFWCESNYDTHARDYASGTHWGIPQMGPTERKDYGPWGSGAWRQVEAARRLWTARRWQPWQCHPYKQKGD